METIRDSKAELEQSLRDVLRSPLPQTEGYVIEVDILENDRKKRSDASRESWRPAIGEIRIRFGGGSGPGPIPRQSLGSGHQEGSPGSQGPRESRGNSTLLSQLAEVIQSLRDAEKRPGFHFVALKWFRDLFLPAQEYEWAASPSLRDDLMRHATDEEIILTHKVPNPKSPAFPVTAIRLNRHHPEVVAVLGEHASESSDFDPVHIDGEPLSETVLRERR